MSETALRALFLLGSFAVPYAAVRTIGMAVRWISCRSCRRVSDATANRMSGREYMARFELLRLTGAVEKVTEPEIRKQNRTRTIHNSIFCALAIGAFIINNFKLAGHTIVFALMAAAIFGAFLASHKTMNEIQNAKLTMLINIMMMHEKETLGSGHANMFNHDQM